MDIRTARDIPVHITSANTASERRITPSWTLAHLKARLEPITGIPSTCQRLTLRDPAHGDVAIEAPVEDEAQLSHWPFQAYIELNVEDTRPQTARNLDFNDLSSVEKYTMSKEAYSTLPDSVLAWKKSHKLGRFDPDASEVERKKIASHWHEAETKGIDIGRRCRLGSDSTRIGTVAFIGEVPEIPELGGPWVGVVLDEPMGKNNGTIGGRTYFSCPDNRGVFVRPERVYIGDFRELFEEDEDMEEI